MIIVHFLMSSMNKQMIRIKC